MEIHSSKCLQGRVCTDGPGVLGRLSAPEAFFHGRECFARLLGRFFRAGILVRLKKFCSKIRGTCQQVASFCPRTPSSAFQ